MRYALLRGSRGSVPARVTSVRRHSPGWRTGLAGRVQPRIAALAPLPVLQAKLKVGAPNDSFEHEAERVADQVMRMPDDAAVAPASAPAGSPHHPIQRTCDDCADEKARLQRMPRADAPGPPRISALSGLEAQPSLLGQAALAQDIEEERILQAKRAAGA